MVFCCNIDGANIYIKVFIGDAELFAVWEIKFVGCYGTIVVVNCYCNYVVLG